MERLRRSALAQRCAHPGGANTDLSAELQTLFDQLKQNADRNRLLSTNYPYEVVVERKIGWIDCA